MESSLSLSKADLESEVGEWLGWGRGPARGGPAWTPRKIQEIKFIVDAGLRQFYNPPTDGNSPPHSWSFLRPTTTLTLAEGESTVELPDDFGTMEDDLTVTTADGTSRLWSLPFTGSGVIRQRYATNPELTGTPQYVAVQPKRGVAINKGQRSELYFFPISDNAYTLQVTYSLQMNSLTSDRPYPYGGGLFSETILASCLAMAELKKDNAPGNWANQFRMRLTASIATDRRNKPAHFGYNGDRSDGPNYWPGRTYNPVVATFAGLRPDQY